MGKMTGFLEYTREEGVVLCEKERIKNFNEFHGSLDIEKQRCQAARCMDCGVPFCQFGGNIAGMTSGCPLGNLVPEINELFYQGAYELAYNRLMLTHNFPEFTSRVCPALCENACTCGLYDEPVCTKENEKAIIEYAFANGLVKEEKSEISTGKKVAVVGSGPSGLAVASMLNRRGHKVTVYERSDKAGGLLRYGIPNMKLEKYVIDRRIALMEEGGIEFVYNKNVEGKTADKILKGYDAVVLACGASKPRDINVSGRDANGIYFAVDFLGRVTKELAKTDYKEMPYEYAEGKNVVVIGGGDTGNDCVGTAVRLKAKSVTQLEMMPALPEKRGDNNPWPEWPKVLKTDYGQEEAAAVYGSDPRIYKTTVKRFIKDKKGNVKEAELVSLNFEMKNGKMSMSEAEGSERIIPCDLVLIAAGFLGSEEYVTNGFAVETDNRSNVKTNEGSFKTSRDKVYVVGDMHTGQSLVVKAIAEGRKAAKEIDEDLMGYSNL